MVKDLYIERHVNAYDDNDEDDNNSESIYNKSLIDVDASNKAYMDFMKLVYIIIS